MQKCNKSLVLIFLITLLSSSSIYSQNLVTNGDFGTFDATIFSPAPLGYSTTTYVQEPYNGSISSAAGGKYAITNEPRQLYPIGFVSTKDHTTADGNGNMMFVDGKFNTVFWKSDPINLQAGVTYLFTYYIKNISVNLASGPPKNKINFVGCTSCSAQTTGFITTGTWEKIQYSITPTVNETISIELSSLQNLAGDNFVIDDISLTPPQLPLTASFVQKNPVCPNVNDGYIVAYPNSGFPTYTFNLTGSKTDSNSSGIFTGLGPGSYVISVTDSAPVPVTITSSTITLVAPTDMTLASSAVGCVAPNSSITLTASNGVAPYTWSASTGVAIPSTTASVTVTPAVNTTYTVTSSRSIPNTNLITNGDFESGTSGFFSDYVYTATSASLTQFDYGITTNPSLWNATFISSTDRSGTGKMFVTKGATTANKTIWSQSVTVDNSKAYTFDFYVQNAVAASPAQFRVLINGIQIVVSPVSATNAGSPGWTKISGTWNSGINTTAKIQIIDTNIALAGNDFAIDDISFSTAAAAKNCSLTKTVQAKVSLTSNFPSIPAFCTGSVAPILSTTSPNSIVGSWSPATVSNTTSGSYTFTPDSSLDACAIGQAPLLTTVTPVTNAGTLSGTQNVCIGLTTTFSSTVSGGVWSSSNNSIATINSSTGVVTGFSAGTVTMTYTLTGTGGCSNDSKTRTVTVTAPPTAATLSGIQNVCVGLTTSFSSNISAGTWSSSDNTIATVNPSTGLVTGVGSGTAAIFYTIAGTGGCSNVASTRNTTVTAPPTAASLSGTQNVCVGLTTSFSSNISAGTWSSSDNTIATVNSASGLVTGIGAGTATITYTITGTGGCANVPSTRSAIITTPPSAGTLSGTQNVCQGLTTSFSSTVSGGSWSSSDITIATVNSSSGLVTGVAAGTATITYTVSGTGGCANDFKIRSVTVTAPPTAASLSGTQNVCVGLTTSFSSNISAGTWSSSDNTIATVNSASGLVTGIGAGTATITYTITGTGGCANVPSTRSAIITTPPSAGTLSGTQNVCQGLTTSFSSTVSGGSWSSSDITIATVNSSSGLVTGVAAGTATITYTVSGTGGCANDFKIRSVTVTAPPTAASLSGTQNVCVGLTTSFSSNISAGTWSSSDNTIATVNSASGLVTGIGAGTATITYTITGTGGCANVPSTRSAIITTPPSAGTLSGTQNVCQGLTTSFSSTVSGGSWSSSDITIATVNSSSGLVTGVAAGTATITYTVSGTGGCANDFKIRSVTVTAPPTAASLSGTQNVCVGLTTSFSSNISAGTWSSSDNTIATVNSASGLVTGIGAGTATITYTITGTGGCANVPSTRSAIITTPPSAGTLSGTQNVCQGLTTSFSSTVSGGSWSSSDITIATVNSSSGLVTGVAAGTATITYTVSGTGGCANDFKISSVTVTAPPTAASLSGTQNVCVGLTTSFSSNISAGTWSSSDNTIATVNSASGLVTGIGAGTATITYTITGTGGCANVPSTRNAIVTAAPDPGTLSGTQNICIGLTSAFSSTVSGGTWSSSDTSIATVDSTTGVVTGLTAGTATITYSIIGICLTSTATRTVTVTAAPVVGTLSGTQSICVGLTTSFKSTTLGGTWSSSDTAIATIDSATGLVTGIGAGTASMTYKVTGTGGCSDVSDIRTVTVTAAPIAGTLSGIQEICAALTTTFTTDSLEAGVWSSSDTSIATVDSTTGVVTGLTAGTATITYTVAGTGGCLDAKATRTVTVTAAPVVGTLSGTQSICVGLTTSFKSTTLGGTWSSSDTAIATIDSATGLVTGIGAGTASMTYKVTGTGGCSDVSDIRTVTVTAAPIAGTLSGIQEICAALTTTFTTDSLEAGVWSSSDTSIATVDSTTGVVTGLTAGTATITYTVAGTGGCLDAKATRTVTVTAAPVVGTLSGTQSICVGLTTSFKSTTLGGTWSSSDTAIATIDSATGLVTGIGAGTATMTYKVTGTGGCSDVSDIRTVTVTAAPIAGTLSGIQEICAALTTTFTTDSLEAGVWSSSDTSIATVDSTTGVVTGLTAGTATITYTVAGTGGCLDAKATRTVTVTAAPVVGTLSGTQSICVGLTTSFKSTTLGGTWSSSDTAIATIDSATGLVTGIGAGTATMTYKVTGTGGCSDVSDIRTVTVTAAPIAGTLSGIQEICAALTTTFTTDSLEAGVWSSSDTSIATVDSTTGVVTGLTAGTATITYTVAGTGGCLDAKATRTVTVTAAPVVGTLSGTQSICVGLTTSFKSTTLGGTWSSSDTAIATIDSATGLVTGIGAGTATMTYKVTGTGGCSDVSDIRTVTVTAAPIAGTLSGIQEICAALTTTFTTDSLEAGVWSSSDTSIATVDSTTGVVTGLTAGTATITYTVAGTGGCLDAKATRTVTVTAAPVVGTLSGTQSICVGLTTSFKSTTLGGTWSSSDTAIATIDSATGLVTGIGAGTASMTYKVTGTGGCSDVSDIRTVTVTAAPIAGTLSGIQEICAALTTTFTTDSLEAGVWSSSDTSIATVDSTTGVVTGLTAGTATITYTVAGTGGCLDAKATRTVTVTAAPVVGTLSGTQSICVGLTTSFKSTTLGGTWSSSDTAIATIDSATGLVTGIGAGTATMTYKVTGTGGCSDVSDIRTVTVTAAPIAGTLSGIQEICAALTTTFTTDSLEAGVWSSSDTSIATVDSTTGVVTGLTAGTATITYTVAGTGGCLDAKATRTVTVTAAPVVGTLSGTQSICVGLTTSFKSTTLGGTWSSSDTAIATIDSATGLVTGIGAGTASMIYTVKGNGGCDDVKDALAITVNSNDTPLFTAVPPVCYGATILPLPTTSDNNITGTWSPALDNTKTTLYTFTPTLGLCAVSNTLEIEVLPLPIVTATPNLKTICSGTSPNITLSSDIIPGTTYDWTVVQTNIIGANNGSSDIIDQTLTTIGNDAGEALYTITPTANGCQGLSTTTKITVYPIPDITTSSFDPICSEGTTNISLTSNVIGATFSWTVVSNKVLGAFSSTGKTIAQTLKTATNAQGSVDYTITPLSNGCLGIPTLITVVVNPKPDVFGSSKTSICSGDSTNIILSPSILGTQFDWTVNQEDGVTGASLGTGDLIAQTLVAGKTVGSATYTVTPTVGGCTGSAIKIKINVNPAPTPAIEDGIICVEEETGETLKTYILDTELSNSNYDFKWYLDDEEIIGASENKYEATDVGVYSVIVSNNTTSCISDKKDATVTPNYPAKSFSITTSNAFDQNATLTITVDGGSGPFLYQLDNGVPQSSAIFTNVSGGLHTVFLTDVQGCTELPQYVTVIDYPKYFTPNGDGFNDKWNIIGLTNSNITIYDRYGKLIKQINTSGQGWDGSFNGQLLPSTDYWFTVEYIEPNTNTTKVFKSHFTLKR